MPDCSKCGKPVSGPVCPNCQTPVPSGSIAKQADANYDIYEDFTPEEITIFNQYLHLVQSGWLEVAAVDRLSTDYDKSLDDIKSIIKRGLKALQKAMERVQKEAGLKARQLAKEAKKNARLAAKQAKKAAREKQKPPDKPSAQDGVKGNLKKLPFWLCLGLVLVLAGAAFIILKSAGPPPAPVLAPAKPAAQVKYFLHPGRVACYQQSDMENITRSANNRQIFEEILGSGRCFISSSKMEVQEISALGGSVRKGYAPGLGWIFFHDEGLEKEIVNQP